MNMDFCFMDDACTLAVTGWSTHPHLDLTLIVDGAVVPPALVTRHVRRDLRSSDPMGIVALFDLSEVMESLNTENCTIHLATSQDFIEIHEDGLSEGARRLIEFGVDEVFFALLRLLATSKVKISDQTIGRDLCTRLRSSSSAGRETENYILACDRCQVTASGQGSVVGWFMSAASTVGDLCALAIADGMAVAVDLLANSMARADLAGYASRYRFSGRDGYGGGWRFPRPPAGPVRLLVMPPGEHSVPSVFVNAEQVDAAELARNITTVSLGIEDITLGLRLRRATLPDRLSSIAACEPVEDTRATSGNDTLLVLDHDLADSDLRDVLRRIGTQVTGPLRLHLLRPRMTPILRNGIEGASREIPSGLVLDGASLRIDPHCEMPARVIFARSATLFQFDASDLFTTTGPDTRVMLHDPIGTVLGADVPTMDRFIRDLLPFALSMNGPTFFALLEQIPDCFLTEEARIRLLTEKIMELEEVMLIRVDTYRHFEGKAGPHCESLVDGFDWHSYDAESRRMLLEAQE